MADGVERLLAEGLERRLAMGRKARDFVERHFDVGRLAEGFESALLAALDRGRSHAV
jgi:hypothetical protein